jgi:hypothetical protein
MIMVECDKNMIVCLLRNWRPNRLLPKGYRLSRDRPMLIANQNGKCPLCAEPLTNDGKATHIDHEITVKVFADKVLNGELTFDDAYRQLWDGSNLRATHRGCNYARNESTKSPDNTDKFTWKEGDLIIVEPGDGPTLAQI